MTQNKKKGIAKKALSISLVAAMLATSNVPAWASGFEAVDAEGFAVEEATPVDAADLLAAGNTDFDADTFQNAKNKIVDFVWYDSVSKMNEILTAAKAVKMSTTAETVADAEVGLVDAEVSATNGKLPVGREFYKWDGKKYSASEVGKKIMVKLILEDKSEYYFGNSKSILAADATNETQIKDWSVVINGKTFTKNGTDKKVPVSTTGYNVEAITLTLGDGSTVSVPDVNVLPSGTLTISTDNIGTTGVLTIDFGTNYKGVKNVLTCTGFTTENKQLPVTISSGTLTYDPTDIGNVVKEAEKLVNAGDLDLGVDYEVSLTSKLTGETNVLTCPNAGENVYVTVTGIGAKYSVGYDKVVKKVQIAPKNLNTLYVAPEDLDITYDNYNENSLIEAIKYNKDAEDAIDDLNTIGLKATVTPVAPKAGEKITLTVEKNSNINGNYTGTFKLEFTPKVSGLPSETDFESKVPTDLVYDGIGWDVDKLFKDSIGDFTRAEYKVSCKEVPSGQIKDAGDYTLVMTIVSGAYAGQSLEAPLTITPAKLLTFKYGKGVAYNTITWEPGLKAKDTTLEEKLNAVFTFGNTKLVKDKDYKVTAVETNGDAEGNLKAGDVVTVKIEGVDGGNFDGANEVSCALGKVAARELPELPAIPTQEYVANFGFDNIEVANAAGGKDDYSALIKDGETPLVKTKDYEVKLSAMPASGEGQMTLTLIGIGNYTGVKTKTFEITKQAVNGTFKFYTDANHVSTELPALSYNYDDANAKYGIVYDNEYFLDDDSVANAQKNIVVVKADGTIVNPANYTITYKNNKAVGTATIEANGKDGYDLHVVGNFEITPMQITSEDVEDVIGEVVIAKEKESYDYTGEAITPKVTLKKNSAVLKDGKYTLVEGTDYKVEYKNNVNVPATDAKVDNKPQIIITGLGNYVFNMQSTANVKDNTGIKDNFVINHVDITKASVTANSVEYAGGIEVTPDITIISPVTKKVLVAGVDYVVKLEKAVNAGTATATIKAVKDNYNFDFGANGIEVKFEITKKLLSKCDASVVDGKVVIRNNGILVPASEYTVTENEDGTFTVKAAEKNYTGTITVVAETAPEATTLRVTDRTTSTVSLAWDEVEGAEGYTIWFRSEYETSVSRKIVQGGDVTTWTQKGLQPGTKYFYTVKAWVKDADGNYVFSEQSPVQRGTTKPLAAKITAVSAANGKVKVTLAGKAAGAEMYSMCYSKSASFDDFKVGIRTSYTTRTFKNALTAGTYYVRVKSYRDLGNNKRVYGAWSNTMKVVVK